MPIIVLGPREAYKNANWTGEDLRKLDESLVVLPFSKRPTIIRIFLPQCSGQPAGFRRVQVLSHGESSDKVQLLAKQKLYEQVFRSLILQFSLNKWNLH